MKQEQITYIYKLILHKCRDVDLVTMFSKILNSESLKSWSFVFETPFICDIFVVEVDEVMKTPIFLHQNLLN